MIISTGRARVRRTRSDLREQLLESALVEFAAKGFDGASTRSIAERVDAHQPQINYHFDSKEALWTAPSTTSSPCSTRRWATCALPPRR